MTHRNFVNLKKFVQNHIIPWTNFTHDGWQGYNFLDGDDSVWTQETHNHGHGDFGYCSHSTSYIEGYWSEFKKTINNIYDY